MIQLTSLYNIGIFAEAGPPIDVGGSCGYDEVLCPADKICIPKTWLCDGVVDCPTDVYDERQDGFVCCKFS